MIKGKIISMIFDPKSGDIFIATERREGLDLDPGRPGDRTREMADRVADLAKQASGGDPAKDTSEPVKTRETGNGEATAPICTCAEMENEGQKAWDCPKHGRVAPGR